LVEKTATEKNEKKGTSKPQRNKFLITGDSHARGYAADPTNYLSKTVEGECCDACLQA